MERKADVSFKNFRHDIGNKIYSYHKRFSAESYRHDTRSAGDVHTRNRQDGISQWQINFSFRQSGVGFSKWNSDRTLIGNCESSCAILSEAKSVADLSDKLHR